LALITVYTGGLKSGKSQAAMGDAKASPLRLWIVPTSKNQNPLISSIPFMRGTEQFLPHLKEELEKHKEMRLVYDRQLGAESLFQTLLTLDGVVFIFDDLPAIFPTDLEQEQFFMFIVTIRHQESRVVITTQRFIAGVPKNVRAIVEALYQVGPFNNDEEARKYYGVTNTNQYGSFEEFNQALKNNPQYALFPIIA
jgi:hypothetical protein